MKRKLENGTFPSVSQTFSLPPTLVNFTLISLNLRVFFYILDVFFVSPYLGAVHKVRHARGEKGVREGVTVCDRGQRGSRVGLCDVTLIHIFIIHLKHDI